MALASIISALVAAALATSFAAPAAAQPLRLLSMWRHVGDDGFALAPCSDTGLCPAVLFTLLHSFFKSDVSDLHLSRLFSTPHPSFSHHAPR